MMYYLYPQIYEQLINKSTKLILVSLPIVQGSFLTIVLDNIRNMPKLSPDRLMHTACAKGNLRVFDLAVDIGADNFRWGMSLALAHGHSHMLDHVLRFIDKQSLTVPELIRPAYFGNDPKCIEFANTLCPNVRIKVYEMAKLSGLCAGGHKEDVEKMIQHIDDKIIIHEGLYSACYYNHPDIIQLILSIDYPQLDLRDGIRGVCTGCRDGRVMAMLYKDSRMTEANLDDEFGFMAGKGNIRGMEVIKDVHFTPETISIGIHKACNNRQENALRKIRQWMRSPHTVPSVYSRKDHQFYRSIYLHILGKIQTYDDEDKQEVEKFSEEMKWLLDNHFISRTWIYYA